MARISKDWVDIYIDNGIDKSNRRIFMFDDIDDKSIGTVIKGLYYMDSESTEKPIELFIGSFGGSEYDMFALYDVIRTLESPIYTIAIGKCMSAGPLLVACGEQGHRYATPNTFFMVHQSWDDLGIKRVDELKKDLQHYEQMADSWYSLMEKHTKQSASFWKKECQKVGDKYFDAEQAKEWGIIDHIWSEKDGE